MTSNPARVSGPGGLNHLRAYGDGNAPHPRETATWLTGFPAKRDMIENAISVDQIAAQKLGAYTPLSSLELGMHEANRADDCQMGYTCAYNTKHLVALGDPADAAGDQSTCGLPTVVFLAQVVAGQTWAGTGGRCRAIRGGPCRRRRAGRAVARPEHARSGAGGFAQVA